MFVLINVIAVQTKTCVQSVKLDIGEANVSKIVPLHAIDVQRKGSVYLVNCIDLYSG